VSGPQESWKKGDFAYITNCYGSTPDKANIEVVRAMVIWIGEAATTGWVCLEYRQCGQVLRGAWPAHSAHRSEKRALEDLIEKLQKQTSDFPSLAHFNGVWARAARRRLKKLVLAEEGAKPKEGADAGRGT
jgi:hypothetical protein